MGDEAAVETMLDGDESLASTLETILAVDEEIDEWTFDDIPTDSGTFGRLVAEGVIVEDGGGYRVADRDAVERLLQKVMTDDESADTASIGTGNVDSSLLAVGSRLPWLDNALDWDRRDIGAVLGIIALFIATRAHIYDAVFRDGDVVLTANDPYYYRYWVETLLAISSNPLDVIRVAGAVGKYPLFELTLWFGATLFGGTHNIAAVTMAWYPVVAAAMTGLLMYVLGSELWDRRVGIVAAVTLGLLPAYATRTGLGFADHHPFDYLWLTVTVVVLCLLVSERWRPLTGLSRRAGSGALGLAVACQTLAWNTSLLLVAPIALYMAAKVLLDVRADRSPWEENVAVVGAIGFASGVSFAAHVLFDWMSLFTALTPNIILFGSIGVIAVGELGRRNDWSPSEVALLEIAVAVGTLGAFFAVVPVGAPWLASRLGFLFGKGGISETQSLFTFGNYLGAKWFGLTLVVSLMVMMGGLWQSWKDDTVWLALSVYGWFFLILSVFQIRVMSFLAVFVALFVAVGFVNGPARVGVWGRCSRQIDHRDGSSSLTLPSIDLTQYGVILVCLGLLLAPNFAFLGQSVEQTTYSDDAYETAAWLSEYAAAESTNSIEDRVFSRWSVNRMYNYFANGNSNDYSFAKQNYRAFVFDDDPGEWYRTLSDRVGFVVIEPLPRRRGTIQSLLYQTHGSEFRTHDGVSHYRAIYSSDSGTRKVFDLVAGARLDGTTTANTSVQARIEVDIPNDSFPYRQTVRSDATGNYTLTVPYPGRYEIEVGNQTRTVRVPESAVENGTDVLVSG